MIIVCGFVIFTQFSMMTAAKCFLEHVYEHKFFILQVMESLRTRLDKTTVHQNI